MGPLAACVYGADKALPLHDTYILIYLGQPNRKTSGNRPIHTNDINIQSLTDG